MRRTQALLNISTLALFLTGGLVAPPLHAGAEKETRLTVPSRQQTVRQRREAKRLKLRPEHVSKWERLIRNYERRPFFQKLTVKGYRGVRLALGGMPSGSGFVFGGSAIQGRDRDAFTLTTRALYSSRGYSLLEGRGEFPKIGSTKSLKAFAVVRYADFTALNFFGTGPDSSSQHKSTYRLESRTVGGGISYRPVNFLELGGEIQLLNVSPGSGSRGNRIETILDPAAIPGFNRDQEFLVTSGRLGLELSRGEYPQTSATATFGVERYSNRASDGASFTRWVAELRGQVPLGNRSRRLAMRARTTHGAPDAGQQIPLYLMETIGGGTTLRGFPEYRFRDRHTLLMNLEYRWEVWGYTDFVLFSDAGKVFGQLAQLDLSNLKSSVGAGIRFHTPGGLQFRIDVARSNEGFQVHIGTGPRF